MEKENNIVKIVNIKQAIKYMQNGANPIKVYYTNKIVYEFNREQTKKLFDKWVKYQL